MNAGDCIIRYTILSVYRGILNGMDNETTHTRILRTSLRNLRRIHAETNERQIDILDRLLAAEWQGLQSADSQDVQIQAVPLEKE